MNPPLDNYQSARLTAWLKEICAGNLSLHLDRDQTVTSGLTAIHDTANPGTRRQLETSYLELLKQFANQPAGPRTLPHYYVANLIRLASDLKLPAALPALRQIAARIPETNSPLTPETGNLAMLALLNLEDPQPTKFLLTIWQHNPIAYSAVVFCALLDNDLSAALELLPKMPNNNNLGDQIAFNLDYKTGELAESDREPFRQRLETFAAHCQPAIKNAIFLWLTETL